MSKILISIALLTMVDMVHAQDSTYKRESPQVFDQARLIDINHFTVLALRQESIQFVARQCAGRTIARLILAPTQQDLAKAVNATFMDLSPQAEAKIASAWPSVFGKDGGNPRVAQVLCFGGAATLTIRDGNTISRHQLSGAHDSREWVFKGVDVTIVGFRFFSQDVPLDVFVRVKTLPSLNTAAAIRDELQDQTRVDTVLIVRTDPFFWTVNGPACDIFEVAVPAVSGTEFLGRQYLECAGGRHEACRAARPAESR